MTARRTAVAGAGLVLAAGALTGCGSGAAVQFGAVPAQTPSIYPIIPEPVEASALPPDDAVDVFVVGTGGAILPDPGLSPGDAYPDVTAPDVCDLHYTQGVRQPRYNTKVLAFANYGVSIHERADYQVDKLIPVSLGGSNAIENIWPQPYDAARGALEKDAVERQLRGLVCSGTLTLAEAQQAIATDWSRAYDQYMGLPVDPGSTGPEPWRPSVGSTDPFVVTNQGPCEVAGEIGYTEDKHIRFTCTASADGILRWTKRY